MDTIRSVGAHVRRIRSNRGLSLSELARQSGVAKATLIGLESGRGNPTLETLMALATSLGVPLAMLIAEGDAPVVHVTRAHEGTLIRGDGVRLRLVHRMTAGTIMYELFDMVVDPGLYRSPAHAGGVVEHIMVHAGTLRVGPDDAPTEVSEGDFVSFSADRPHFYEAIDSTVGAMLTIVYPVTAVAPRVHAAGAGA